jgi:signal transduction histidine kinase
MALGRQKTKLLGSLLKKQLLINLMKGQLSARKIRYLRNILLGVIGLAASLSLYNVIVIYPSFTRLLVQYTQNDAVRAARYVSETLPVRPDGLSRSSMDETLIHHLQQVERSLELIKLKIYTADGHTIYSTDPTDIGSVNTSIYFKEMAVYGAGKSQIVDRNAYSLEGVKVKTDVVEVYVPLISTLNYFSGAVEIYYDISRRKKLMDRLIIHSTFVLAALVGGLVLVVFLLVVRESNVTMERRVARRQIEESQEKLSTILDAIPDMILLVDHTRKPVWYNQRARDFWGDVQLDTSALFLQEKTWIPAGLSACFERGEVCEEDMELAGGNGRVCSFFCTANGVQFEPFEDASRPRLVLLTYRDVTEKKILQAETVRAGQLASIGELAAGVAHEINNPINGIINCSQLLLDDETLPVETHGIARRIFDAGDRVAMIVRSLLSFARIESDRPVLSQVGKLINDTLELTAAQIKRDMIKLDLNIPEILPEIEVHPQQIQQVFLNILSNSRHAIAKRAVEEPCNGHISITGRLVSRGDAEALEIIFTDNGIGIPEQLVGRACNPFFTTKPPGEGTGLGLSISQSIMENHKGDMKISNANGPGAIVRLVLPVNRSSIS